MGAILSVAPSHAKNGYYVGIKGVLYIQICETCPFLLGGMSARTLGRGARLPLREHLFMCMFLRRVRFWSFKLNNVLCIGLVAIQW